jgi:uncharacterized protein (DUF2062 family)
VRFVERTAQLLRHAEGSPSRVAAAFGIGVFIAFFPILGIHTGMAIGIALLFRLNKVAILAGAWLNNPWTLAPIYSAGTLVGCALLRVPLVNPAANVDWSLKGRAFYSALSSTIAPLVWPFVIGNLVLGAALGLVAFFLLRSLLARGRQAAAQGGPA